MITQQISTININMINTTTTTLVEQQLNQKRIIANHIKQNGTNQPSNNLLQYVSPFPSDTQPPIHNHTKEGITTTDSNH